MPDPAAKLAVVVGAPLAGLPQIDEPSAADVAKWHAAYVAALRALFDRHKAIPHPYFFLEILNKRVISEKYCVAKKTSRIFK